MKQDAPKPRKKNEIVLFVVRSGPKKGKPECEAAFTRIADAVDFLTSLHGLDVDEARRLGKERSLALNRKWHGAEVCTIEAETMSPTKARHALSGELYTPRVNTADLPTPRAISFKTTLSIKLKSRRPTAKKARRKSARTNGKAENGSVRDKPKKEAALKTKAASGAKKASSSPASKQTVKTVNEVVSAKQDKGRKPRQ